MVAIALRRSPLLVMKTLLSSRRVFMLSIASWSSAPWMTKFTGPSLTIASLKALTKPEAGSHNRASADKARTASIPPPAARAAASSSRLTKMLSEHMALLAASTHSLTSTSPVTRTPCRNFAASATMAATAAASFPRKASGTSTEPKTTSNSAFTTSLSEPSARTCKACTRASATLWLSFAQFAALPTKAAARTIPLRARRPKSEEACLEHFSPQAVVTAMNFGASSVASVKPSHANITSTIFTNLGTVKSKLTTPSILTSAPPSRPGFIVTHTNAPAFCKSSKTLFNTSGEHRFASSNTIQKFALPRPPFSLMTGVKESTDLLRQTVDNSFLPKHPARVLEGLSLAR